MQLGGKPYYVVARFKNAATSTPIARRSILMKFPKQKSITTRTTARSLSFVAMCKNKFGTGLFIDVHGQAVFPDNILVGTVGGETVKLLRQRHGDEALVGPGGVIDSCLPSACKRCRN